MSDEQWHAFFLACSRVLGPGTQHAASSQSWCAWTTFEKLSEDVHYWKAGLPSERELGPSATTDGGTWGQPFLYQSLAHVVVPRCFQWELHSPQFATGKRKQPLDRLSVELVALGVPHRTTNLVLELKFY